MAPPRKAQSEKKAIRTKKTAAPADPDSKSSQNSTRQKRKKSVGTQRTKNNPTTNNSKKTAKKKYDHDKPATDEQKGNFVRFLNELYDTGINGILNQYATGLKAYVPDGVTRVAFDKNMDKNRYKDVICSDNSRVILNDGAGGDYIHANHVNDPVLINRFICTQGPMANTIVDFWRMILQENVENIVMLCQTTEQGKEKCQQYWPLQAGSSLEFSGIVIKNLEVDTKSDTATIISSLEVVRGSDKITLKHHQWRTWPDRSVPQSVMAPFRLLKIARASGQPTVVHCSAGVGRTGTVVALEVCLQTLLSGKSLSVLKVVQDLRAMRMHCVQTDLQLVFICKCLAAFAASRQLISGDLTTKQDKFDTDYSKLIQERAQPENDVGYTPLVPVFGFGGAAAAPAATPPAGPTSPVPAVPVPVGGFFLAMNAPTPAPQTQEANKDE